MMTGRQGARLILFLPGIISVYCIFIGTVSINVGMVNSHEDGSIIAVLSGLVLILFALVLFYGSVRLLSVKNREKDMADHI